MATFLVLQQELGAQVGLDQTVSAQATLLKRWLNNAQQMILRAFEWPFLRNSSPLVVQTVVDYTTGTVATTTNSTSITFSSAPSTSKTVFYFQSFNPGFLSSGTPRIYCMAGVDSSGYPQFRLWPNPDAAINLNVFYLKNSVDMSADGDVSVIPAKWHTTVLLEGAKEQGFSFLDDSRYGPSYELFQAGIEEMKTEYELGLHRHRVMTAADNQPVGGNLGYMPLPFNYPRGS